MDDRINLYIAEETAGGKVVTSGDFVREGVAAMVKSKGYYDIGLNAWVVPDGAISPDEIAEAIHRGVGIQVIPVEPVKGAVTRFARQVVQRVLDAINENRLASRAAQPEINALKTVVRILDDRYLARLFGKVGDSANEYWSKVREAIAESNATACQECDGTQIQWNRDEAGIKTHSTDPCRTCCNADGTLKDE